MGTAVTPLTLLVNPSSAGGKALKVLPRVEAGLDALRVPFRVVRTKSLEHAIDSALGAVEGGEVPVAMSGDGMIGAIGGAMAGSDVPLGIVPCGRGNDLARILEIPVDPDEAVAVLVAGATTEIDVGEANGQRFLGIASTGFDSEANYVANKTRWLRGNLVYAYAGIRTLLRWKPARFTVQTDGGRFRFSGYSVSAANNKAYGGGMLLAPDADLRDGEFDVIAIAEGSKFGFLCGLPRVFKGTHVEKDEVTVFRARRIELSASRPFAVYADGEHLTDLPATLRLLPRALKIIVPARSGE